MNKQIRSKAIAAGATIFWLIVWQIAATVVNRGLLIPIPTPVSTAAALVRIITDAESLTAVGLSVLRILAGFVCALIAGTILAILSARSTLFRVLTEPLVQLIRAIPVASFTILLFLWVSRGKLPSTIAFFTVLPVVWANVESGITAADRDLIEMARVFGMSGAKILREIILPGIRPGEISVHAVHQRVPLKVRAFFDCDDEMVNRIWEVSKETYRLCSGLFFIDGIKRDRWVWSGDAYQSMMINPYLFFDREIDKRTSRALRGNTEIRQHINTIVDYTMLWLISIQNEFMMDGDKAYVREMYPKMEAVMNLLFTQTDGHGFVRGRDRDWIYIDWADIDKTGPISAEQVLLWKCCKVMAYCAGLLAESGESEAESELGQNTAGHKAPVSGPEGHKAPISGSESRKAPASSSEGHNTSASGPDGSLQSPALGPDGRPLPADHVAPFDAPLHAEERAQLKERAAFYETRAEVLRQMILDYYWDEEKGALIDSFTSGRRNVTRHANIFAVLFDFADERQRERIRENVFNNEELPQITTPYFKFFELDALGKLGDLDKIWETLHSYWGGMIERGAVTFWELFDPKQEGREQYGMYGDPFGKRRCHAWGASPIYLIGKYFLGVRPTSPGYKTYEVKPAVQYFDRLDCTVPAGDKSVRIVLKDGNLEISEC